MVFCWLSMDGLVMEWIATRQETSENRGQFQVEFVTFLYAQVPMEKL